LIPRDHDYRSTLAQSLAQEIHDAITKKDIAVNVDSLEAAWKAHRLQNLQRLKRLDKLSLETEHKLFMSTHSQTLIKKEGSMDTIAVGISRDGREITIAGNVKRREGVSSKSKGMKYTAFGLSQERHESIIRDVVSKHPELREASVRVISPTIQPINHEQNAEYHAEMQLVADSVRPGAKRGVPTIGVSKPPCEHCWNGLHTLPSPAQPGLPKGRITHWMPAHDSEIGEHYIKTLFELPPTADSGARRITWGRSAVLKSDFGEKISKTYVVESSAFITHERPKGRRLDQPSTSHRVGEPLEHPSEPAFRRSLLERRGAPTFEELTNGVRMIDVEVAHYDHDSGHATLATETTMAMDVAVLKRNLRKGVTHQNIQRPPTAPKKTVTEHIVHHVGLRPRITGSIGATMESIVDNIDRPAFAEATDVPSADANTYTTRTTIGAYARAGTVEATAGFSVGDVSARGPNVAAGAQLGLFTGVTAYAKAEVARAEVNLAGMNAGVGLNGSSGISIGPLDGVDVSLLGFGFSIGPKLSLKLPVADVSCIIA
jgi:hypothetical protein